MNRNRISLYLLRLLVYSPELNELVLEELDELLPHKKDENLSSSTSNDQYIEQFDKEFEDELYQNVWAAILEDEMHNDNSNLSRLADYALPNNNDPYGFRSISNLPHPSLDICDIEADIVRLAFNWYINFHYSLREIAKNLENMQVPTHADIRKVSKKKFGRAKWHSAFIRSIFTSKIYTGKWQYFDQLREEYIDSQVPSIISNEDYQSLQKKLRENANTPSHVIKYDYLLINRVFCEACSSMVRLISNPSPIKTFLYYRCPTKKCVTRGFPSGEVDRIVWSYLTSRLRKNDVYFDKLKIKHQIQVKKRVSDLQERLRIVTCYLHLYQDKLNRLKESNLPDNFLVNARKKFEADLTDTIENLEASITSLNQQIDEGPSNLDFNLEDAEKDLFLRRTIVSFLDVQIWIHGRNDDRTIKICSNIGNKEIKMKEWEDE